MKKGLFYTLSILLLLIPAVMLIVFYVTLGTESVDDEVASLRCDQLHYFVEDVKKDLLRANVVFGRRAAVYAVDYVVAGGVPLENYSFNCSTQCSVNCITYTPPEDGGEAAIAELILCGTLAGENASFMTNHTLPKWIEKVDVGAHQMNFNSTITVRDFKIIPYNAFNFSLILDYTLDAEDASGLCYFRGPKTRVESITSIAGVEDPLKPLNTKGRVFSPINDCPIDVSVDAVLGSSRRGYGNGTGAGNIIYAGNMSDPSTYCSTHNVSGKVLVVEEGFGSCNLIEQLCFNASAPEGDHFEGVINFGPDDPQSFSEKCDITIPWISDTGELNLSYGQCVALKNIFSCSVHDVLVAAESDGINTSCYQASELSDFEDECGGPTPDGPSFFDRLEGRLELSERYVNQSKEYYNNTNIGLESLLDLHKLRRKNLAVNGLASWIDYLYWQNATACVSLESCVSDYAFKVDCAHAYSLGVDTTCVGGYNVKPTSNITSPAGDFTLYCNDTPLNVSGSAYDCDGNVSKVEFGVDDAWAAANGTINWSTQWSPTEVGHYLVCSRATDDRSSVQEPSYCLTAAVACCGGAPALSASFATGYPQKNPGTNKPVRVKVEVVDQDCTAVSDATVNVTADGNEHPPEYDVMLHNGGGIYGDGTGTYWESNTLFGNDESINITVTAEKPGYAGDSVNVYLFVHFI